MSSPFRPQPVPCYRCSLPLPMCVCLDRALQLAWLRDAMAPTLGGGAMGQRPHDCPGGCGTEVPAERLACKEDWFRLPNPLRKAVGDAYRRYGRGSASHRNAVACALRWYRDNPRTSVGVTTGG